MKLTHLVLATSLICTGCVTVDNTQQSWPDAKAIAERAINAGDCAEAWYAVWPAAKNGVFEARSILAGGVYALGMMPPGATRDAINRMRTTLVLSAHGAGTGDPKDLEFLQLLLAPEIFGESGESLSTCLSQPNPDQNACVASAVEDGFLPSFETYASEVDTLAAASPSALPTCEIQSESTLPESALPKR